MFSNQSGQQFGRQAADYSDLARQILGLAIVGSRGPDEIEAATNRTLDQLQDQLSLRFGSRGYRALLDRAIDLATTDFPGLHAVTVDAHGHLQGLGALGQQLGAGVATNAVVALLANLFATLATFLGDDLTSQLVQRVWPEIPTRKPGVDAETEKT